jgi:hypothetical protein
MSHGPLVILATHTEGGIGITRIDVRCPKCGRHMHIERNGKLLPDVACGGGPLHVSMTDPPSGGAA